MNRRQFLETAAGIGLAASMPIRTFSQSAYDPPAPENVYSVPDDDWMLWVDHNAEWRDDPIFLPQEVLLGDLPVPTPTGGWPVLQRWLTNSLGWLAEQSSGT